MSESQSNFKNHTDQEVRLFSEYADYFKNSPLSIESKLSNFSKYVRRQDLSRFLAKNEIFKRQIDIVGSIVECGSFQGGGTLTFAQLSSIYEPYNHTRRVIAFDTFSGFPSVSEKDKNSVTEFRAKDLGVYDGIEQEIIKAAELLNKNRPISHIPKIELVKGNATESIPNYLEKNPHLVVSLLYLDFDLYEPTRVALEHFVPRMPCGSILAFDELNTQVFPGETLALMEVVGIRRLKIEKTPFDPYISFATLEYE